MRKIVNGRQKAIIILHEIYGINSFIEDQCRSYSRKGFDVYCPDLLKRPAFSYDESEKAYAYYMQTVGFDRFGELAERIAEIKKNYDTLILLGFSAGATLAWKCSQRTECDGIIACCGSRIRDDLDLQPSCPTLLLFAKTDSFDVEATVRRLKGRPKVTIELFDAAHGFQNPYSEDYDNASAKSAQAVIDSFLSYVSPSSHG